jgi:hypothetical protein
MKFQYVWKRVLSKTYIWEWNDEENEIQNAKLGTYNNMSLSPLFSLYSLHSILHNLKPAPVYSTQKSKPRLGGHHAPRVILSKRLLRLLTWVCRKTSSLLLFKIHSLFDQITLQNQRQVRDSHMFSVARRIVKKGWCKNGLSVRDEQPEIRLSINYIYFLPPYFFHNLA